MRLFSKFRKYALLMLVLVGTILDPADAFAQVRAVDTLEPIRNQAIVKAPLAAVWRAWTNSGELPKFVGRAAEIEPRARGVYRVVFFTEETAPVDRGNDGLVLAIEPQKMISFTWMTPLNMPELRGNSTVVTLHFTALDDETTRVDLVNSGYGQGSKWQAAYAYNVKGWDRILAALEYRFEIGKAIDREAELANMKKTGRMSYWRDR